MKYVVKVLSLLMLLMAAQQGAVVHELLHVFRDDVVKVRIDVSKAVDGTCAQCPAFAQVVTPAFSHSFQIPTLVLITSQCTDELRILAIDADVPYPRSRGPPSLS